MELRFAIDTNRLTDLFKGDSDLAEFLGRCEKAFVPLPVLAEIKAGFMGGNPLRENEWLLREFLSKTTIDVLLPTVKTAEIYAGLLVQLRRAGTPIPTNDIWIASLVLQHELVLITRDLHFKSVPQLHLL